MIGLQVCCLEAPLTDANIFAGIQQGTNIVLVQGRCQREADNLSGCLIHIIVQRAEKNSTLLTIVSHCCQEGEGVELMLFAIWRDQLRNVICSYYLDLGSISGGYLFGPLKQMD